MTDKLYSNPPPCSNNTYNRPQCAKQILDPNQQQFCTYPSVPMGPTYGQSNNILENFNMLSPQSCPKNQNFCMYTSPLDVPNWDSRMCEDTLKIPDKIEMIEITSKDLSPASYCSNLDLFLPDFYKTIGKDLNPYYNKLDGQWYGSSCNSQKVTDFPSCAQSSNTAPIVDKTVKYCSIQKSQDFDYASAKNYTYNDGIYADQSFLFKSTANNHDYNTNMNLYSNYYENGKLQDDLQSQYFQLGGVTADSNYPQLANVEQQAECSNDESDIIVEESDDDIMDFNEYEDKRLPSEVSRCLICNVSYTPLGTQFYFLTLRSPLTMSTQKPVFALIVDVVGGSCQTFKYLCSECLGLLNTIDHLQLKLDNFRKDLLMKFQRTAQTNGENYDKVAVKKKTQMKLSKLPSYKCKLCKKIFSLKHYCRSHLKRHKFRGFLCEICGKVFARRRPFDLHHKEHCVKSKVKIDAFKCSNCPKSFRTKSNLKEHVNYCLGLLPFACKFCDKKFPSRTKLKNHVKLKHDKKFVAICSICNIGFVKLSAYKAHKICHSTDKKFTCSKCDKSYKTLSNLNFHMKIHNNKMPFICQICNKGFMRKEYLEAHVNNHKGVKNFACTLCDKKFVSQKNLDSHVKYHDGSTKTKTCNICGKVMTTGFEEHLRIHNNLKEFECELCKDRFNTKGTLNKHKKRKHGNV